MREGRSPLESLEAHLGYTFQDRRLLERALTHRSYANERGLDHNYERLEFLGDAILGALATEWLFDHYPNLPEGDLSKLKSALVSEESLAAHAALLGVGDAMFLGVGEERSGGRRKPSLLADCLEALYAALWRDAGPEITRRAVHRLLHETAAMRDHLREADYKTRLQEHVQGLGWERPLYRVVEEQGPDHKKRFIVECVVRGEVAGIGDGPSKKAAEQRSAAQALESMGSGRAPSRP